MRLRNTPKRNLQDKNQYESSIEIKPDWKRAGLITLVIINIFVAIASGQYALQADKALADESLYRQTDREWPRPDSLVYVPFGLDQCLHLVRFDSRVGFFYDNRGWIQADKWLYLSDRRPLAAKFCTTEDK